LVYFLFSEKRSLKVLLFDHLPLHNFLERTNVVKLLRQTPKLVDDTRSKRFRFDVEDEKKKIESSKECFLLDSTQFIDRIECFIVETLKSEESTIDFNFILFACIASSRRLFQQLVQIFVRYVIETDFDPKIVETLQMSIKKIHEISEQPLELYPPHLAKLAGLVHALENDTDEDQWRLVQSELMKSLLSNPFETKVMLLLFPELMKKWRQTQKFSLLNNYFVLV
jgi:hypothetical protein